jgi:hypothetical protein
MRLLVTTALLLGALAAGVIPAEALAMARREGHPGRGTDSGPVQILIIRHGEKPGDPSAQDDETDPNLSVKGRERAAALAFYVPATFQPVDFLFATKQSKNSNRPVETITPLSQAIQQPIDSTYSDDDFEKLAKHIQTHPKYAGKRVLICWHHGRIPDLARALGVSNPPDKWHGDVFDLVWQIDYADNQAKLTIINQKLLYGDSSN